MYQIIEQNIETIIERTDRNHVAQYDWLVANFNEANVSEDKGYQRAYRKFWAMNNARLPDEWFNHYFALLERGKSGVGLDVSSVCRSLYEVPTRKNGGQSLQFSFATKLAHMIDNNKPIFDVFVQRFYYLPVLAPEKELESRLDHFLRVLRFLESEYQRVLDCGLLKTSIQAWVKAFQPKHFSRTKVIDSLIWSFGNEAMKGAFVRGEFVHS